MNALLFSLMLLPEKQDLIADLSQLVTAERQQKIESVLQQRTRHITVILEDIFARSWPKDS